MTRCLPLLLMVLAIVPPTRAQGVLAVERTDGALLIRLPAVDPSPSRPDALVFTESPARAVVVESEDASDIPCPIPRRSLGWKTGIVTTVFWVGELPTARNPVTNAKSSWDQNWRQTFGGCDDPGQRDGWRPRAFLPRTNPFYIALPYNDVNAAGTKPEARWVVPWFARTFTRPGVSVLKGRWVAVRKGSRTCYAQWEDCGPFRTDHWRYVFGDEPPGPNANRGAGLDVSPAVRDYLGLSGRDRTDWRFVEAHEVPDGPWRNWLPAPPTYARNDAAAPSGAGP